MQSDRELLTPQEVADIFRVDLKTVSRWAQTGKLPYIWTPGNRRRFPADEVWRLARGERD